MNEPQPISTRKQELIEALLDYLQQHGVTDLSLRPMAAATGTSARLLIFHFGSKENLLGEVLAHMQQRLQHSFAVLAVEATPDHPTPLLRRFWEWALLPENLGSLRLLYQLHLLATQHATIYAHYLQPNALNWVALIAAALPPPLQNPATATLFGAVFDGLFIEFLSTGDRRRTTAALDAFILLIRAQAGLAAPGARRPRRAPDTDSHD